MQCFDTAGSIKWLKHTTGTSEYGVASVDDLILGNNEVLITGTLYGTHTFVPLTVINPDQMYDDLLIAKLGNRNAVGTKKMSFQRHK